MNIHEITPEEARRKLDAGEYIYLDVRTVPEFAAGHAVTAINIPVAEINPALGRMELNPHFVRVVEAGIPKDAKVIVGCKSGQRSAAAIEILQQAGYRNLVNLAGGFGGVIDSTGQVVQEGWSTMGYPIERGQKEGTSYESLCGKAGQKP